MIIEDRVYGKINIQNKLILDLIESSPMQRLKKVGQAGPTSLLRPERNISRFEHSIGVWYLLNKFGATPEEQVAGLLHDTPHTAFSHVADVVFPNDTHNFHEQFEEKIILNSEIPAILNKHKMNVGKILDKRNFHLLEIDLPDLSADRIDYFLRDTRVESLFPDTLVDLFLGGMQVRDSRFYFKDSALARLYALLFMDAGKFIWLDPDSHGSYGVLGGALKKALVIKLISMEDLFKTDDAVLDILKKSNDKFIKECLVKLTPKKHFIYASKSEATFWGPNKPRAVDPLVEIKGGLVRISEIYPELTRIIEDFKNTYRFIGVK